MEGYSLLDVKQVFETAPEMIKDCVEHLKDPSFYPAPEYRVLMLYGPSGSGKSTMARAVAQYAGWDAVACTPADFQVGNRNEAAEKLRKKINELINRDCPTVLIIDEVNQLLENSDSKHHDNDATSKEFWNTIDRIHGNNNFFIIGTSNRIHKVPSQIKTRIKSRSCEIAAPPTMEAKLEIFKRRMNRPNTQLSPESLSYARQLLEMYPKWTARDYVELAFMGKVVFREKDKVTIPIIFTPTILREAIKRLDKFEVDSEYYSRDKTDEERQDFYQAQNVLTQLLIQTHQKHPVAGLRAPGITMASAKAIANRVLPVSQKRLVDEELDMKEVFKEDGYFR